MTKLKIKIDTIIQNIKDYVKSKHRPPLNSDRKPNTWGAYAWWQKAIFSVVILDTTIFYIILSAMLKENTKWLLLAIIIISLLVIIKLSMNSHFLKKKSTNLFIFGAKGDGKDMLIQKSVYLKYDTHTVLKYFLNRNRKTPLANDDYGYGTRVIEPKEIFNLAPNTYANLIESKIKLIDKVDDFEGRDYYLTDSAVYFPSQEDSRLNKEYPSFPLFYALSRHLYNMNIIVNTQVGGRLWKKLREQVQDGYIEALGTTGFSKLSNAIPLMRKFAIIKCRYYSKLESAERGLLPFMKLAVLNKVMDKTVYMTNAGATEEQYRAENGIIKDLTIIMNKNHIKYDTRIFHEKMFGYKSNVSKSQYLNEQKALKQFRELKGIKIYSKENLEQYLKEKQEQAKEEDNKRQKQKLKNIQEKDDSKILDIIENDSEKQNKLKNKD